MVKLLKNDAGKLLTRAGKLQRIPVGSNASDCVCCGCYPCDGANAGDNLAGWSLTISGIPDAMRAVKRADSTGSTIWNTTGWAQFNGTYAALLYNADCTFTEILESSYVGGDATASYAGSPPILSSGPWPTTERIRQNAGALEWSAFNLTGPNNVILQGDIDFKTTSPGTLCQSATYVVNYSIFVNGFALPNNSSFNVTYTWTPILLSSL